MTAQRYRVRSRTYVLHWPGMYICIQYSSECCDLIMAGNLFDEQRDYGTVTGQSSGFRTGMFRVMSLIGIL